MKAERLEVSVRPCHGCGTPITDDPPVRRGQWKRYCSNECRTTAQAKLKSSIRQLQPGEQIPPSEPKRYTSGQGYIRLRWRIAPRRMVETYEHRVNPDGRVTDAEHVHHHNGDKTDNTPSNLIPLTADEHTTIHADHRRQVDRTQALALYQGGLTTTETAARLHCHTATISRILAEENVPARPQRDRYPLVPHDVLHATILANPRDRVPQLAVRLNVPRNTIRRSMKAYGIPSFPSGRQPT